MGAEGGAVKKLFQNILELKKPNKKQNSASLKKREIHQLMDLVAEHPQVHCLTMG